DRAVPPRRGFLGRPWLRRRRHDRLLLARSLCGPSVEGPSPACHDGGERSATRGRQIITRGLQVWLASCGASALSALLLCAPAGAAMTVSSTGDSGGCSLRSVIEAVEANTSNGCGTVEVGTTTIHVPDNTITLSTQLVVEKGSMAIVGNEGDPTQSVIHGGTG